MLPAGVVTGAASDTSLGVGRVVGHLENQDAGWLTSGLADGAPSQVGPAGAHALQAGVDVLVGVCDGHGPEGLAVARRVVNTMPSLILQQLKRAEERAQDGAAEATALALSSAFVRMDAKLTRRQAAGGPSVDFSGTTCTAAVVSGRLLTVAWVGDSRAVLARRAAATGAATAASGSSHVAVDLTVDHTADLESERERIASHGGVVATAAEQVANTVPVSTRSAHRTACSAADSSVAQGGPLRVWVAGKQYPGLMTTRSLGDSVSLDAPARPATRLAPDPHCSFTLDRWRTRWGALRCRRPRRTSWTGTTRTSSSRRECPAQLCGRRARARPLDGAP